MEGLQQALQATPDQHPQKVVDAIVDLLAMPFGKPFRTVVDYTFLKEPVEAYNNLCMRLPGNYTRLTAWKEC
ncbi:MAG: hypothetical protein R2854_24555 [Caldilineaceae bacterium]